MESNRISGEFPTRLIDSSAPANDTPVISAYNSVYYSREVGLLGAQTDNASFLNFHRSAQIRGFGFTRRQVTPRYTIFSPTLVFLSRCADKNKHSAKKKIEDQRLAGRGRAMR